MGFLTSGSWAEDPCIASLPYQLLVVHAAPLTAECLSRHPYGKLILPEYFVPAVLPKGVHSLQQTIAHLWGP